MPPSRKAKKGAAPKPKPPASSGSASSNTTSNPSDASKSAVEESEDSALERFPLELRWCLQQLEQTMEKKKSNPKEAEDLLKSYKTLAGRKAPFIKKRQLMRSLFGDYRKKMAEEEKKFKIGAPALKTQSEPPGKSRFIKQKNISECSSIDGDKSNEVSSVTQETACERETAPEVESAQVSNKLTFNSGNSFRFNFTIPS